MAGLGLLLTACNSGTPPPAETAPPAGLSAPSSSDPMHATYLVEGRPIALVAGRAERELAPDSAQRERTFVLGKPVYGDLDGDDDAGVILVRDAGGSGTFYYLAAAVKEPEGYRGTNALFLGDRIAGPAVSIRHGLLMAAFRDRDHAAPISAVASADRVVWAVLDGPALQMISGDPSGMQLMESGPHRKTASVPPTDIA